MSGKVFHEISEGIMAQSLKLDVKDARDSASVFVPDVKAGNILAADYVLKPSRYKDQYQLERKLCDRQSIWGKAEKVGNRSNQAHQGEAIRQEMPYPMLSAWESRDAILHDGKPRHKDPDYTVEEKLVRQSLWCLPVPRKGLDHQARMKRRFKVCRSKRKVISYNKVYYIPMIYSNYKKETEYEVTRITQKHRAGSNNRRC